MRAEACRPPLERCLVSVVLPVYNESLALQSLVSTVTAALETLPSSMEIIFVNDGSHDGSAELLDQLAASDETLRVIHFSRNFGHQAAVQAGLQHARGDAVIVMDADMQDAPDALPRFVEQWHAGYDVVYAVRTDRKENLLKRILFTGFYRVLAAISTTPIPLDAGNFGLVDRRVLREIVNLAERDRYYSGLRSWVGFRQCGLPVERLARYDDQPRVGLRGLFNLAKTAVFSFSTFPLTAFYAIGMLALAVFAALGAFSLYCRLFTTLAIPGWTSHILSACFFGALNALGISILGEYVMRIYDQVRGRPMFIVQRTVNVDGINDSMPSVASSAGNSSDVRFENQDPRDKSARTSTLAESQLLEQATALLESLERHSMSRETMSRETPTQEPKSVESESQDPASAMEHSTKP
jgi:dolichol-phosphate mannosyltransferase